jgi:GT2 family glycosyltransferase
MDVAAKKRQNLSVEVFVSDNSVNSIQELAVNYSTIFVRIFPFHRNLGYLGGVMEILKELPDLQLKDYNYVIISNVDILLPSDFFGNLLEKQYPSNVAWIAPQIFSFKEKTDRNPKILVRPTSRQIENLRRLFSYPFLYNIYRNSLYLMRKKKRQAFEKRMIYAGHGSFMIFTGKFMEEQRHFKFPSFLFCEEMFWGELVRQSGYWVAYEPNLRVQDVDHVSTGKLKNKIYCKMNFDSLSIIKELFYE